MRIKRVEIVGFKSFVDKVCLDFQDGTTAVVGPNGCGKSNIVDAIRWSMGEQNAKNLRGRMMEDIIFGGSESRRPLGMAEVSLIFSNDDGLAPPKYREYSEIMITRRLHRSGDSEYLLNKTPCRLLDITELFMDTGVGARAYSIIEQGKIGMILNAKPEDRRSLIEEAAGVTKYKSRKKSALRKIEATRQNLLRLGDIVAEVRRQMNSLKRQAQKAERYRSYRDELKEIELRFARERYCELRGEREAGASAERQHQSALDQYAARLEQGELKLEELRLTQAAREKEVTGAQERVFHLGAEIEKVEGRLSLGEKELDNLGRQKERLAAEAGEAACRLSELDGEEERLQQGQAALEEELERDSRRLTEGEALAEELADQERESAGNLEKARAALYALLTELSRMSSQQDEAQRRLLHLEERTSRNHGEAITLREEMEEIRTLGDALEKSLEEQRQYLGDLRQEREDAREAIADLRRQLDESEKDLLAQREELNRHRSRLDSLQQLERDLEGYGRGVKTLLGDPRLRERFGGMAADGLEVPATFEIAAEAALGDRLQALLAGSPGEARAALDLLSRTGGRCTLLLPAAVTAVPPPQGARPLAELIGIGDEHRQALQALLAGVHLVESLEPFFAVPLPAGALLVTVGGETLSWRGEYTGGGKEALDQGLLHKKREVKELIAAVAHLEQEVDKLQAFRLALREKITAAEETQRQVESDLHRQEIKILDGEKDRSRHESDAARLLERLEVLSLEEDQLHEEREELERVADEAIRGREQREQRKSAQEELVARLQENLMVQRREMEVVREQVTSIKVSVASLREREEAGRRSLEQMASLRKELRGRTALLQSREEEGEQEKKRLREQREGLRTELDVLRDKREEERQRFDRVREGFEEGGRRIESQETALKELRRQVSEVREEVAAAQMKSRELQMEAEHLRRTILDRHRIDLAEQAEEEPRSFDAVEGERRMQELRRRIEEVGEVNLTAIDEYRELEERWTFLTTQQEDLRRSLEGLQAAISKINRTTRKRFRETFEQVNAKFQGVFPRLFRGGKAELKLTDEHDLLETGIEIVAQPPGKKLQNVNLLSGGEKALTAVALIFSIFLIKPSPFCVLDEVDAPLDDANIGRFNEIVHEMSRVSQFVIITHNKRTMEIADTLYGVTMEEPGVSKLVSVRINEIQE